jgi:hypothetical protein
MNDNREYHQFRIWIRSTSGPYEQYNGKVDVWAESVDQAKQRALNELKRGAFPDRNASMWRIERVEVLQ